MRFGIEATPGGAVPPRAHAPDGARANLGSERWVNELDGVGQVVAVATRGGRHRRDRVVRLNPWLIGSRERTRACWAASGVGDVSVLDHNPRRLPVVIRRLVPLVVHHDGAGLKAGPVGVELSVSKSLLRMVLRCFSNT
eukprot:7386328-Prymnesium_polylepis.1